MNERSAAIVVAAVLACFSAGCRTDPVEEALRGLESANSATRVRAVAMLGDLGDPRAVDSLVAALHDGDAEVRQAVPTALQRFRDPASVRRIVAATHSTNPLDRAGAVLALGRAHDAGALGNVVPLLQDSDEAVVRSTCVALAVMADPRAIDALARRLASATPVVRRDVVGAVASIGGRGALDALLPVLADEDEAVSKAAGDGVAAAGAAAVEPLIAILRSEKAAVGARIRAAAALGQIGDSRAIAPLVATLPTGFTFLQEAVEGALVRFGTSAVEPLLATLRRNASRVIATDEDGFTNYAITERVPKVLGKIGAPAVEPLIAALQTGGPYVRERAAVALGETHDPRGVEPLVGAVRKDASGQVRYQAIEALGNIRDARAVPVLVEMLSSRDTDYRGAAAGALAKMQDARAGEALVAAFQRNDVIAIVGACRFYVARGEPGSEDRLIAALERQGDSTMAEVLINSGNERLADPARQWARTHHYQIFTLPSSEGSPRWGSGR